VTACLARMVCVLHGKGVYARTRPCVQHGQDEEHVSPENLAAIASVCLAGGKGWCINSQTRPLRANEGNQTTRNHQQPEVNYLPRFENGDFP